MSAKYLCGFSRSACKIGIANAAVFPDPVSASPITSLPKKVFDEIKQALQIFFFFFLTRKESKGI